MAELFFLRCTQPPFLRFVLTQRHALLGRSPRCTFVVDEPSVSRKHAEIRQAARGLLVTDLESRNGTFLGNQRVRSATVRVGETIRFGAVSFQAGAEKVADLGAAEDETGTPAHTRKTQATPPQDLLTPAQKRVFDMLMAGHPEKAIAHALNLSPHTVHNHVKKIYQAFGVHSRAELLVCMLHVPPEPS